MLSNFVCVSKSYYLLTGLLLMLNCPASYGWEKGSKLHLQFGAYAHYGSSDDHEGPPIVGNLEFNSTANWLLGLSLFNNSFGQFSQYAYFGKKWELPTISEHMHVKLTGGLLQGYTGEFEDKIPFNNNGFAPAIVPSIGFKKGRVALDLIPLGTAGLMLAIGYDIHEF